jgi:streptogramin lyase
VTTKLNVLFFSVLSLALLAACGDTGSSTGPGDTGTVGDTSSDVDAEPSECEDPDNDGWGPGCPNGNLDCMPFDETGYPGAPELCNDFVDNDCDGDVDEDCPCTNGRVEGCYTGPDGTEGVGICSAGFRVCDDGEWTACSGSVTPRGDNETLCDALDDDCDGQVDEGVTNACGSCGPAPLEICGDGLDNDCDGIIDNVDAGCDCDDRTRQACYSGPPTTLGVGRCRGGFADCGEDGAWLACVGELLPQAETCDGVDNDCDGAVDEGLRNRCGVCGDEEPLEVCDGVDNDCDGAVDEGLLLACGLCPGEAPDEICGDGLDNDCDSLVDEACPCSGTPVCYPGPEGTAGVGVCREGTRTCDSSGEFWTACTGFVLPSFEICDGLDNDCDGVTDVGPNGCSVCGTAAELCDGVDNDCDGQIDEGLINACGDCIADVLPETECNGLDDNCDGRIDEGLVNACGTCDESCYVARWDDPEDWSGGTPDGLDEERFDDGLVLGTSRVAYPDLWIANSDARTVTRVNTDSAESVGTFPVGLDPSRTAVDFNGDVYVANRAFNEQGSVTKILSQGCVGNECIAWTVPVGDENDLPRGLAVDRDGYVWVGTYNRSRLYRLDPEDGEIVGDWDVPVRVYGLAIDSEGVVWIATLGTDGIGAFDSETKEYLGAWAAAECSTPYGIAVDGNGNVWAGSWNCDSLLRLDRSGLDEGVVEVRAFENGNLRATRGVTVDGDGMIYVTASGTDRVGKFNPSTSTWEWTVETCETPIGAGVASDGNIWVVCQHDDEARRYDTDGIELDSVATGNGPYSYSDMTGFQLRNFTAPSGTWSTTFDCGYAGCEFDRIEVDAATPAGTGVQVRARTRPAEPEDAPWSPWTPYITNNPAEIGGLLPAGRYCEVEVRLSTEDRDVSPIVTAVDLEWQRP